MWDSNSPLQLLNTMPKKLTKENLEKLQLVIDADKYKNSLLSGFDLCGMYAPFCRGCKKTSIYPCAIAYINMMKSGGMDIEIDAKPVASDGRFAASEKAEEPVEEVAAAQAAPETEPMEEAAAPQEVPVCEEEAPEPAQVIEEEKAEVREEPQPTADVKEKHRIRIAVARRKFNS